MIKYMYNCKLILYVLLCATYSSSLLAADSEVINIGTFTNENIKLWKEKTFEGHTKYKAISTKDGHILKASCDSTASALYRDMKIDLTKTPILQWSWKVDNIHKGLDDISKQGDDYAARIYVVYKKGILPWNVRALNYVWANKQSRHSSWNNAFTSKAIMIAQESGTSENKGIWINESRNIYQDFRKYFNIDVNQISGVAIMSDCDNAKGKATGYYKNIRFTNNGTVAN